MLYLSACWWPWLGLLTSHMLHTSADSEMPQSPTCFFLQRLLKGKHQLCDPCYNLVLPWAQAANDISSVPTSVAAAMMAVTLLMSPHSTSKEDIAWLNQISGATAVCFLFTAEIQVHQAALHPGHPHDVMKPRAELMRKIVSSTTVWHPSLWEGSRKVLSPEVCDEGEECRRGEE